MDSEAVFLYNLIYLKVTEEVFLCPGLCWWILRYDWNDVYSADVGRDGREQITWWTALLVRSVHLLTFCELSCDYWAVSKRWNSSCNGRFAHFCFRFSWLLLYVLEALWCAYTCRTVVSSSWDPHATWPDLSPLPVAALVWESRVQPSYHHPLPSSSVGRALLPPSFTSNLVVTVCNVCLVENMY